MNEYAAFLLDHCSSSVLRAGVQPTALVRVANSVFHLADENPKSVFRTIKDKVGSFQLFAPHECTSEDMGPSQFPAEQVHRIAALDIRLCNTDRHSGNILVRRERGQVTTLVPIDHGYALPSHFGDATFEWLSWPASKEPFSEALQNEILSIDPETIEAVLKKRVPFLRPECLATLSICTALLKHGVQAGLTAFAIGSLMVRPTLDDEGNHQLSELEHLVVTARTIADESSQPTLYRATLDKLMHEKCREVVAKEHTMKPN